MAEEERETLKIIAPDEKTEEILKQLLGRYYELTIKTIETGIAYRKLLETPEGKASLKTRECLEEMRIIAELYCRREAKTYIRVMKRKPTPERIERCVETIMERLKDICSVIYILETTLTKKE